MSKLTLVGLALTESVALSASRLEETGTLGGVAWLVTHLDSVAKCLFESRGNEVLCVGGGGGGGGGESCNHYIVEDESGRTCAKRPRRASDEKTLRQTLCQENLGEISAYESKFTALSNACASTTRTLRQPITSC